MENLNGKFGHVIDNELHCSELEIGMVYFIDYGNNPNLLTSVNKFIDDFKKNGESSFMLFKYEVKVLSAEDMPSSLADKRDMTFGRDFRLFLLSVVTGDCLCIFLRMTRMCIPKYQISSFPQTRMQLLNLSLNLSLWLCNTLNVPLIFSKVKTGLCGYFVLCIRLPDSI